MIIDDNEMYVSGQEAKYYVLGGMTNGTVVDEVAQVILRNRRDSVEYRVRQAVALMKGHAEHTTLAGRPVVWHRLLGTAAVSVGVCP